MPILTIAALTLREAVRRRIAPIAAGAGVVLVLFAAWGFGRLAASAPERSAGLAIVSVLTIFLAFVFSVVLGIGAAFLAAPAIAADVESGVASAILPRPLSRTEFVLGKWLGLIALVAAYAGVFGVAEFITVGITTGYRPPHPAAALAYLIAQGVVLVTLALLFSTRLTPMAGGFLSLFCFGGAWIAGIAGNIAAAENNAAVRHAATLIGLLVPSDVMWRGAVYALEPVMLLAASSGSGSPGQNPFGGAAPPSPALLTWTAGWIGVTLGCTILSFARRDI